MKLSLNRGLTLLPTQTLTLPNYDLDTNLNSGSDTVHKKTLTLITIQALTLSILNALTLLPSQPLKPSLTMALTLLPMQALVLSLTKALALLQ